jgi:hypothetical protein
MRKDSKKGSQQGKQSRPQPGEGVKKDISDMEKEREGNGPFSGSPAGQHDDNGNRLRIVIE